MVLLPQPMKTSKELIDAKSVMQKPRPYLGMSGLGHECFRALWLNFRWASPMIISARTARIFERGDLEEARIIRDLRGIGVKVKNEQLELVDFENYMLGHIDGECENLPESKATPHLLEFKTMGQKYFDILLEKGVKVGFPSYYIQSQVYMYKRKLKRTLFIATNKDDEQREHERIHLNKRVAVDALERGKQVIACGDLPIREMKFQPTYWKCRWCKHGEICHGNDKPQMNCRTCFYCDLIGGGKWACSKQKGAELSVKAQTKGCGRYKRLF